MSKGVSSPRKLVDCINASGKVLAAMVGTVMTRESYLAFRLHELLIDSKALRIESAITPRSQVGQRVIQIYSYPLPEVSFKMN